MNAKRLNASFSIAAIVAIACAIPLTALADSYLPFLNFRQVEPTGRFYVVFKELPGGPEDPGRGTPVSFEFVERKEGSKPVLDASDAWEGDAVIANPDVKVREGDIVQSRGKLARCPGQVLISADGAGFVGLDVRGYNFGHLRSGDALVVVGKDGKLRHGIDLVDLFRKEEVEQFLHSAGGVFWLGGGWIDDKRKQVVVVSTNEGNDGNRIGRLFRIVDIESGKVRPGSRNEILTALEERNIGALSFALELAAELKLNHMALPAILDNEQLPPAIRLRAAVALAASGDRRGAELMRRAALEDGPAQLYAVRNLPKVLNGKSAAVLCEVVRRFGDKFTIHAWDAMHDVPNEAAVPELVRLLKDATFPDGHDFALECLGDIGPAARVAVPEIKKVLHENPKTRDPQWTRRLAESALQEIEQ